jgi:hypothetical protein
VHRSISQGSGLVVARGYGSPRRPLLRRDRHRRPRDHHPPTCSAHCCRGRSPPHPPRARSPTVGGARAREQASGPWARSGPCHAPAWRRVDRRAMQPSGCADDASQPLSVGAGRRKQRGSIGARRRAAAGGQPPGSRARRRRARIRRRRPRGTMGALLRAPGTRPLRLTTGAPPAAWPLGGDGAPACQVSSRRARRRLRERRRCRRSRSAPRRCRWSSRRPSARRRRSRTDSVRRS